MKAVLFDADGVTIKDRGYFSDRYARDAGVSLSKMTPFYTGPFQQCLIGEKDLKEELTAYLPDWKWEKTADEFIHYWFSSDAEVDHMVMAEVEKLRAQGIKCYLVSNQDKYRGEYIRTVMGFNSRFDGCFFSNELGVQKTSPKYFEKVIQQLALDPKEVTYFDDDKEDIAAALSVGINAIHYDTIADLRAIVK